MSITFLDHDKDSIDFIPLLKNGSIHYVSVAMPGLTFACANIRFAGDFEPKETSRFFVTVNETKETGTLYPKLNITLLPSPLACYTPFNTRTYHHGDYPAEDVIAHISDAFKANSQYVKSKKMYFDFRNLCVSETHYISCLKAAIDNINQDNLPEIITWNPR